MAQFGDLSGAASGGGDTTSPLANLAGLALGADPTAGAAAAVAPAVAGAAAPTDWLSQLVGGLTGQVLPSGPLVGMMPGGGVGATPADAVPPPDQLAGGPPLEQIGGVPPIMASADAPPPPTPNQTFQQRFDQSNWMRAQPETDPNFVERFGVWPPAPPPAPVPPGDPSVPLPRPDPRGPVSDPAGFADRFAAFPPVPLPPPDPRGPPADPTGGEEPPPAAQPLAIPPVAGTPAGGPAEDAGAPARGGGPDIPPEIAGILRQFLGLGGGGAAAGGLAGLLRGVFGRLGMPASLADLVGQILGKALPAALPPGGGTPAGGRGDGGLNLPPEIAGILRQILGRSDIPPEVAGVLRQILGPDGRPAAPPSPAAPAAGPPPAGPGPGGEAQDFPPGWPSLDDVVRPNPYQAGGRLPPGWTRDPASGRVRDPYGASYDPNTGQLVDDQPETAEAPETPAAGPPPINPDTGRPYQPGEGSSQPPSSGPYWSRGGPGTSIGGAPTYYPGSVPGTGLRDLRGEAQPPAVPYPGTGVRATVANLLAGARMSPAAIAGIMRNVTSESAWNPGLRVPDQPHFRGEAHFAHGLYQEGGEEWNNYQRWLTQQGFDWRTVWRDPALQTRFLVDALQRRYPRVWDALNSAGTPAEAAEIFMRRYLRPSAINALRRALQYRRGVPSVEAQLAQQ